MSFVLIKTNICCRHSQQRNKSRRQHGAGIYRRASILAYQHGMRLYCGIRVCRLPSDQIIRVSELDKTHQRACGSLFEDVLAMGLNSPFTDKQLFRDLFV